MARFDPENPQDIAQLRNDLTWSEQRLKWFRQGMVDRLRQFAGAHYGEGATMEKVPINLIELGVNIFLREIASGTAQALVTPRYEELKPGAADLEIVVNQTAKAIDLSANLNSAAADAMFMLGVVKVGVCVAGDDEENYLHDSGQVFADAILPEDYFCDMRAKRWTNVAYEGNHFRANLEWARNNPQFDKKLRETLTGDTPMQYDGDRGGNSIRAEALSQGDGNGSFGDEYCQRCDLIEIWLPEEGLILTLAGHERDGLPLRTVEWKGPKRGPYHKLLLEEVPGNLMPLAPTSLWEDLHVAGNQLLNKVIRQAERQKTITGVQGHAKDDGSRVLQGNDGEMILMQNPEGVKEFSTGGANKESLGMVIWLKDLCSYLGGNWDSLGGLAPQTKTATQDKLLNASASGRAQDMQNRMLKFTKAIMTDMAWHVWHDPLVHIPFQKPIQGTGLIIPAVFTPERRKGEFFDYSFEIDPYSLQASSPSERVNALQQFVMQMLMPAMPLLQQNGIALDWEKLFKIFAQGMRLPELNDIIKYQQGESHPPDGMPQGQQQQPAALQKMAKPPQTTRNYVRSNVPVGSSQGKSQQLSAMLFNGGKGPGVQPAEMAGLVR